MAGEGDPQREGAVVADVGVGQQLDEALAPEVGDAVDLLAAAGALHQAALADPGLEGGQLAGERAGHGRATGTAVRSSTALTAPWASRRARAGYSEPKLIEARLGQQLTEPLLQLVAVELLLREQAEDGEVDHEGGHRYIGLMYRFDATTSMDQTRPRPSTPTGVTSVTGGGRGPAGSLRT